MSHCELRDQCLQQSLTAFIGLAQRIIGAKPPPNPSILLHLQKKTHEWNFSVRRQIHLFTRKTRIYNYIVSYTLIRLITRAFFTQSIQPSFGLLLIHLPLTSKFIPRFTLFNKSTSRFLRTTSEQVYVFQVSANSPSPFFIQTSSLWIP